MLQRREFCLSYRIGKEVVHRPNMRSDGSCSSLEICHNQSGPPPRTAKTIIGTAMSGKVDRLG
jgi:hypothetical protein